MANLANIVNLSEQSKWDVPVTIHRTKAVPLDNSSYFLNLDDAKAFAASKDNTSFVSQVLNVLNVDLSTVDQYQIMDEDGTLLRIASETDTRALSSEVSKLWADVKGGVNYKGHIKTIVNHKTHEELPLSILFGNFYNTHGDTAGKILYEDLETGEFTWLSSIPVNNGWMYCVSVDVSTHPDKKYVTEDGIELTDRDYIIVHDHDLSAVQLSDINRSNVDIIETQDDDYVRTALLAQISDYLSTDYVSKIAVAKGEAQKYSDDNFVKLSGNNEILNGNNRLHGKNWINDLSADIMSVDFCKLIDDDFGKILSTRIKDLNENKATVLALALRVNEIIDNAEGLETLPKIDVNANIVEDIAVRTDQICEKCDPIIPESQRDLTTLEGILNTLNKTLSRLRISGQALSLDTRLKNLLSSIDFIESYISQVNYDLSALCVHINNDVSFLSGQHDWLSIELSTRIDELSNSLCGVAKLSIENLQKQIISNDNDIKFLSNDICRLCTEISSNIDNLSTSLSDIVKLSIENIQNQIVANDKDISCLSAEISSNDNDIANIQSYISGSNSLCTVLSDLEDHYNRTFTKDVKYSQGDDIKVDLLNIFDSQDNDKKFTLMYLSGTLVLSTM